MNPDFLNKLTPLYEMYNEVIKPLIVEIEVRFEEFPTPIFNEIRAFNDHVTRCFRNPDNEEWINEQVSKAKGHIERMIFDCYKYLNVSLYDSVIKKFDKHYKRVDLSRVNNGEFQIQHRGLTKEIILNLKKAKSLETQNKNESINLYQYVHNKYTELENLIDTNSRELFWAYTKYRGSWYVRFIAWLTAAIISGVISSSIIPWDKIMGSIISLFTGN